MATVLVAEQCQIPGDVGSLEAFRRWAGSPAFPEAGRIDWVESCIEVDMSPGDIFTHGTLKSAIVARLWSLAKLRSMHLFTGETRVSSTVADLSVEPDIVVVSEAALVAGRVRLVPAAARSGGGPWGSGGALGRLASCPLERLDRVDVNQAAVNDAVFLGVGDDHLRLGERHALRMEHLVHLAIREANDERLERLTTNELPEHLNSHSDAS
ncbi:hypothetical protein EBR56_05165 [bacterium]|nr:hypothetical protein [bacterium]